MKFYFKSTGTFLKLFSISSFFLGIFFNTVVFADVCVWRDPERTMAQIFPDARDYKTLDRKISNIKRESIEKRLGKPLDSGERENWTYYEIKGSRGETLGYIIADAEKGEYGVIEIVMGVMPNGKVKAVYIQRARERDKEFKSKEFLAQFIGKDKTSPIQISNDVKVKANSLATEQVAYGVKKMLVMFDELK